MCNPFGVLYRSCRRFLCRFLGVHLIMAAIEDLRAAVVANSQAIDDLAQRVANLPKPAATEADLQAVTADLGAQKAKLDEIAKG